METQVEASDFSPGVRPLGLAPSKQLNRLRFSAGERAVRSTVRTCGIFSRVNVVLISGYFPAVNNRDENDSVTETCLTVSLLTWFPTTCRAGDFESFRFGC